MPHNKHEQHPRQSRFATARDATDTALYITQRITSLFGTALSVIALVWFGSTCFKLGWGARDNPLMSTVATMFLGLEEPAPPENQDPAGNFQKWLLDEITKNLQ